MSGRRLTRVSCAVCGWVRNVAAGDEGPIRQLQRHALEEHPARLVEASEPGTVDLDAWFDEVCLRPPEGWIEQLMREGRLVRASDLVRGGQ